MANPPAWWFLLPYLTYFSTALLAILCALIIGRAVFVPSEARRGATCGACGHQITEVAQGRCPECGALLLRAGLITRPMLLRHRGSLAAALLAWTVLVITVASWGGSALMQAVFMQQTSGPTKTRIVKEQSFEPGDGFEPARYTIRFDINVVLDRSSDIESGTIEVSLRVPGKKKSVATIDPALTRCTVQDPDGKEVSTGQHFDAAAAAALYTASGLDPADPRHAKEADILYELVQTALADPQNFEQTFQLDRLGAPSPLRSTGGGSSMSPIGDSSGLPIWAVVSMVSTLAVYAAGCIALILLRRRMVSQLYAGSATGATMPRGEESEAS